MLDWIATIMSFVALVFYIIVICILIEIKSRVDGKISKSFSYLMAAMVTLVVIRAYNLLTVSSVLKIPYLQESLVVLFSLLVLISAVIFYRSVKRLTDRKRK